MTVVTNPGSNMKLASGVPRTAELLKGDSHSSRYGWIAASNNCLDMFRKCLSLRTCQDTGRGCKCSFRGRVWKWPVWTERIIWDLRTRTVFPSKLADLCVLDLHQPNMQQWIPLWKISSIAAVKKNVEFTMVDGRFSMKGKILYRRRSRRNLWEGQSSYAGVKGVKVRVGIIGRDLLRMSMLQHYTSGRTGYRGNLRSKEAALRLLFREMSITNSYADYRDIPLENLDAVHINCTAKYTMPWRSILRKKMRK